MASIHAQDSSMNARRNLSSQVDRVVGLIETCCTAHVMSKSQAATYLFLEHDIEPTITETVWNELERQNPEFFKDYNLKRVVRKQIDMHNTLFLAQIHAMPGNSHNATDDSISGSASMSTEMPHDMNGVANSHGHDPACGTSTQVIDPSNMQRDMIPSTSDIYSTIPENQEVCDIDNGDLPFMMDPSTTRHHWMNQSTRMLHEMNSRATHISVVQGSQSLSGMPRGMNGLSNSSVRDLTCRTSNEVISPNNMQCDIAPSTSRMYCPILENQGVCDVNNRDLFFMMDPSNAMQHGMNTSTTIPHGMNSQPTHISVMRGSASTLAGVPYGMNGVANHVPIHDPMCSTPIQVSNPNNIQCGVFPSTPRISAKVPYGTPKQLVFQ